MNLIEKYIKSSHCYIVDKFIISKSKWSRPNDLGFYFRDISINELHNNENIYKISESLHLTKINNSYVINLIQIIKNTSNNIIWDGLIEYNIDKKLLKFKSINNNYFNFMDFLIFI